MTHSHASEQDKRGDSPHRVVVFGVPDDPHRLRNVIAEQLRINLTDAQIQVHGLPGVLPAIVKQHEAAQLAAAIRELGVNATAIPCAEVPQVGKLQWVNHLCCRDAGLQILNLRGKAAVPIPWTDVSMISVGSVPHRSEHEEAPVPTVAVSLATSHRGEHTVSARHDSLELLVITENPLRGLHIDHAHMNYEYLDQRISTSATVNFRMLIQDLINYASLACLTPATRSFLEHGLARHYHFRSPEEMLRYTVFHLILRDSAWGLRGNRDEKAQSAVC